MGTVHEILIHRSFTDFSTWAGFMTKTTFISILLCCAFLSSTLPLFNFLCLPPHYLCFYLLLLCCQWNAIVIHIEQPHTIVPYIVPLFHVVFLYMLFTALNSDFSTICMLINGLYKHALILDICAVLTSWCFLSSSPNVMVRWISLLFCSQERLRSCIGPQTGNPNQKFSWFSAVPASQLQDNI